MRGTIKSLGETRVARSETRRGSCAREASTFSRPPRLASSSFRLVQLSSPPARARDTLTRCVPLALVSRATKAEGGCGERTRRRARRTSRFVRTWCCSSAAASSSRTSLTCPGPPALVALRSSPPILSTHTVSASLVPSETSLYAEGDAPPSNTDTPRSPSSSPSSPRLARSLSPLDAVFLHPLYRTCKMPGDLKALILVGGASLHAPRRRRDCGGPSSSGSPADAPPLACARRFRHASPSLDAHLPQAPRPVRQQGHHPPPRREPRQGASLPRVELSSPLQS